MKALHLLRNSDLKFESTGSNADIGAYRKLHTVQYSIALLCPTQRHRNRIHSDPLYQRERFRLAYNSCSLFPTHSPTHSPTMALKCITIETLPDTDACLLSDILLELGAHSVTTTDLYRGTPQEQSIYGEPSPNLPPPTIWTNTKITALFPLSTDTETLIMTIATNFNLPQTPTLRIQTSAFHDKPPQQWVTESQQSFQPIRLGDIIINFPWHAPVPNLRNITLEPGLAFGTGEHPTTQLCITWLLQTLQPGQRLLDYGTGSGILSIVAVKAVAAVSAVGVDVDADAVRMARDNAKRNQVTGCVEFVDQGEVVRGLKFDVVVANIVVGVLKELADLLVGCVRKGGRIGVSGVLVRQAQEVRMWYAKRGVVMQDAVVQGEWVLLTGVKVG